MKTKNIEATAGLAKRKAWVYAKPERPVFADFLAGGARRKAWFKYHLADNARDARDIVGHHCLKLLPPDMCSAFGRQLARFAVPRYHRHAEARARQNLRTLHPEWSDAEVEATLRRHFDNIGRLVTEFSVVERLMRQGRIVHTGMAPLQEAVARGPVILMLVHLGNWEVLTPLFTSLGFPPCGFFVPDNKRAWAYIATTIRTRMGLRPIPFGAGGMRPALKALKSRNPVAIFVDEGFQGQIMAPFFDREPHLAGNLAIAARLVRHTGATIAPCYVLRTEGCRFEVHGLPLVTLPPEERAGERLVEDVKLLNGILEPIVRANLDQWYFLNDRL